MKNLFKKMSEFGYTQEELASKLGVTRNTIHNMLHSPEYFTSKHINEELCKIFNCEEFDLYSAKELLKVQPQSAKDVEKLIKMIKEEYGNI